MTYKQIINYYGSARKAAEALGITPQCVYNWQNTFPKRSQALVELATKGKLKMDRTK